MGARSRFALLVGVLLSACSCTGLYGRAYGGFFQPELTGELGLSTAVGGAPVTGTIDVGDSLGLDDDGSGYVRIELGAGPVSFSASAFQYNSAGNGTLQANFGNLTAGTPVSTDMEITNIKGALTFNLLDFGAVRISPGVAVDYFDVDLRVESATLMAFEEIDVQVPAPLAFVQTEVDLGMLAATLDVGGMTVSVEEGEGTWWDVEGMVRFNPVDHVELFAGYRWIQMDVDGDSDGQNYAADITMSGWFLGGGVTF